MFVAECFVSLQGEGMLAGTPSFFVRLAGCGLRCTWCDTPHASWRPEGRHLDVSELLELAAASRQRHVVVTGGEPLLQRDVPILTGGLRRQGQHVTVETAGTMFRELDCDLLSLSPKTANSDPGGPWRDRHQARRRQLEPARRLLRLHPEHQVKLVVRGEDDLLDLLGMIESLGVDPGRVLLMPEGRTAAEVASHARQVAALCLRLGWRFGPRLHLELFGAGRGV
ncbi:MAG TPA: 7-carboxy-7-deazaguanine synthase QueE [Thermoanaerobaculaceae bacterium]|nr:7-carboxy-7-deazaguanine synthase QueE [Thermoanaerobaculaceae bacterium]